MKDFKKLKKIELIKLIEELEYKNNELADNLQNLNIKLKYALFDSEAGQREIKYLKQLLKKDKEK